MLREVQQVICHRVIDIFNRQHPGAEQPPDEGCRHIDAGDQKQDAKWQCAQQEIKQFAQFRNDAGNEILHQCLPATGFNGLVGQVFFYRFGQHAIEGGGNQIGNQGEGIENEQYPGNHKYRPQQVAQPVKPAGQITQQQAD